jgi:hypothetical protein
MFYDCKFKYLFSIYHVFLSEYCYGLMQKARKIERIFNFYAIPFK